MKNVKRKVILLFVSARFVSCFLDLNLGSLVQFPPLVITKSDEPMWHNKPFGWQRVPEGPVKEYDSALSPSFFWTHHVRKHKPLIFRGVIKESPALDL